MAGEVGGGVRRVGDDGGHMRRGRVCHIGCILQNIFDPLNISLSIESNSIQKGPREVCTARGSGGGGVGSTTQRLSLRLLQRPHRRHRLLGSVSARCGTLAVAIFCVVPPDVHGRGAALGGRAARVGHLSVLLV